MMTTRKQSRTAVALAATLLSAVTLAACGGSEESGAKARTVTIGIQDTGFNELALLLAVDQGLLEDENITVETVQITDLPSALAALNKGDLDALAQNPGVVHSFNTNSSGTQMQYFAPMQAFDCVILVSPDSGLPPMTAATWRDTIEAFEGHKIGVPVVGGLVDLMLRSMASDAGLTPDEDFQIISVGVGAAAQSALEEGVVDAITDTTLGAQQAMGKGLVPIVDLIEGVGPEEFTRIWGSGYFAPSEELADKTEIFAAVSEAARAGQEMLRDPSMKEVAIDFMVDELEIDESLAEAVYPRLDAGLGMGLSQEEIDTAVSAYAGLGLLADPAPSYDDLVWAEVQE